MRHGTSSSSARISIGRSATRARHRRAAARRHCIRSPRCTRRAARVSRRVRRCSSRWMTPGANGTKGLVARYGDRLVCVRYRYDEERRKRLKTVELIEEESPWIAPAQIYLVKIPYAETELRESVKRSGGLWNAEKKLWMVQ